MSELIAKLQAPPGHLMEFFHDATSALEYLRDAGAETAVSNDYTLRVITTKSGKRRRMRPVRTDLFISDPDMFLREAESIVEFIPSLIGSSDHELGSRVDRILYTATQAYACTFDALLKPNAARKSTGVAFAQLIRNTLQSAGIDNRSLSIAVETDCGTYHYSLDIVASLGCIQSNQSALAAGELVISCMTTTKERLMRSFADKIVLESVSKRKIPLAVIALHDVQRKGDAGAHSTFLPNVFLVNWKHLSPLVGLYYLDLPKTAQRPALSGKIKSFHTLLVEIPTLLASPHGS